MSSVRTDLAMELKEAAGEIPGVEMKQKTMGEATVTRVTVFSDEGAQKIGKPQGVYITIEQSNLYEKEAQMTDELAACLAHEISTLLGEKKIGSALVVGLGNRDLTPDSLGPRVTEEVLVSRHILSQMPDLIDERVRSVCVLSPGVMGSTGMETGEVVTAVVQRIRPDLVLVVDALAARSTSRILSTVQVTDAGVAPGSGVGNHRSALTRETLGVPVIAVGVPMVVHASTILRDSMEKLMEKSGAQFDLSLLLRDMDGANLVVTPVMIDEAVRNVASLVADGINGALQPELTRQEIHAMRI
jgi:spore protease